MIDIGRIVSSARKRDCVKNSELGEDVRFLAEIIETNLPYTTNNIRTLKIPCTLPRHPSNEVPHIILKFQIMLLVLAWCLSCNPGIGQQFVRNANWLSEAPWLRRISSVRSIRESKHVAWDVQQYFKQFLVALAILSFRMPVVELYCVPKLPVIPLKSINSSAVMSIRRRTWLQTGPDPKDIHAPNLHLVRSVKSLCHGPHNQVRILVEVVRCHVFVRILGWLPVANMMLPGLFPFRSVVDQNFLPWFNVTSCHVVKNQTSMRLFQPLFRGLR